MKIRISKKKEQNPKKFSKIGTCETKKETKKAGDGRYGYFFIVVDCCPSKDAVARNKGLAMVAVVASTEIIMI